MEDLFLDSISERLLAIDQKTTQIVKLTGEANRSIDQIRSRLSLLESKQESKTKEMPPPQRVESPVNRPAWSLALDNNLRQILSPILIALVSIVVFSFILTAGLRTALLLPYLTLSNPRTIESASPAAPVNEQLSQKDKKKDDQKVKFKKSASHPADSSHLPVQP